MTSMPGTVRSKVVRHLGKNAPPPRKPIAVDDDGDAIDYRDTTPFKVYCLIVAGVLSASPQSIRQINLNLGDRARPHWTMDALDRVATIHPGYIDRFTKKESESCNG